jgi:hypothetical protein
VEPRSNGAIRDRLLALSPTEFEHAVARLLPEIGYTSVKHNGGAGDRKVDILCRDAHGGLVAVQCKRYAPGKKVTAPDVDDFYGMMVKHRARQGIYVTTSAFTRGAVKNAPDMDIWIIDGDGLAALFVRHPAALGLGSPSAQPSSRTSYEKECRYCHRPIQMREMPDGRWRPFDGAGPPHDCRARQA